MKKLQCLSLLATVAMFPAAVCAQTPAASTLPAPVMAVVEQATLDKSDALKSIVDQVEKKRAEVQKEMTTFENELKAQDKALVDQQKKLSEKEFAEKRQAFEKRVREIQTKVELRRAQMELGVEEAKKKVLDAFLKASEDIRKEVGANVILVKETIVTADPAFDLSAKVLERLNKDLPTVTVTFKSEEDVKKLMQQKPAAGAAQ